MIYLMGVVWWKGICGKRLNWYRHPLYGNVHWGTTHAYAPWRHFASTVVLDFLLSLSFASVVFSTNKRIESSAFGSVFSFSCTLTFSFTCFFSFIIFFCFIVQGLKIVCAWFLGQCVSEIPSFVLDPLAPLFTFRVLHLSKFFLLVNLLHLLFMEF